MKVLAKAKDHTQTSGTVFPLHVRHIVMFQCNVCKSVACERGEAAVFAG